MTWIVWYLVLMRCWERLPKYEGSWLCCLVKSTQEKQELVCRSLLKLEAEVYYYESIVVMMQNNCDIFIWESHICVGLHIREAYF